jgi:hypothetical protein
MPLNVRLGNEEKRMAARLRAAGIEISTVVREAIRAEYARRIESVAPEQASVRVRRILEDLPDPPNLAPRDFSTQDRKAMREQIQRRLARGRR